MNPDLINFIKHLSTNDKKTLVQKCLKTTEEVGELAKAVLPYDNASGTLHRFINNSKILENVADVYLSAISIAYGMGFTDEEIEEMISRKTKKWSMLQANEEHVKFPLPFEIHITVKKPRSVEAFKEACKSIGVKPIIIELEKDGSTIMSDVMTSSIFYGDSKSAFEETERIRTLLEMPFEYFTNNVDTGTDWIEFEVLRTKIETVPWHPAAPNLKNGFLFSNGQYFESHLRIVTTVDKRETLEHIAKTNGAHLSRNFFKKVSDTEYIIMMTLRVSNKPYEAFKLDVQQLENTLKLHNFEVDKIEVEFAIYDSNVHHDQSWIK